MISITVDEDVMRMVLQIVIRYAHGRHSYIPQLVREFVKDVQAQHPGIFDIITDDDIRPPTESELINPLVLREDWLDDLVEQRSGKCVKCNVITYYQDPVSGQYLCYACRVSE